MFQFYLPNILNEKYKVHGIIHRLPRKRLKIKALLFFPLSPVRDGDGYVASVNVGSNLWLLETRDITNKDKLPAMRIAKQRNPTISRHALQEKR